MDEPIPLENYCTNLISVFVKQKRNLDKSWASRRGFCEVT
jgi:hypothetical protein